MNLALSSDKVSGTSNYERSQLLTSPRPSMRRVKLVAISLKEHHESTSFELWLYGNMDFTENEEFYFSSMD